MNITIQMHKYLIMIVFTASLFFTTSVLPKSWLTFIRNNSDLPVTVQSTDPSSKNIVLKLNGQWGDANNQNAITIEPGETKFFNDFVIPWKQFGAQINMKVGNEAYVLQEDSNMVLFTSPRFEGGKFVLTQSGDSVGVYINKTGNLTAKYVS